MKKISLAILLTLIWIGWMYLAQDVPRYLGLKAITVAPVLWYEVFIPQNMGQYILTGLFIFGLLAAILFKKRIKKPTKELDGATIALALRRIEQEGIKDNYQRIFGKNRIIFPQ